MDAEEAKRRGEVKDFVREISGGALEATYVDEINHSHDHLILDPDQMVDGAMALDDGHLHYFFQGEWFHGSDSRLQELERVVREIRDLTKIAIEGSVYADIHEMCVKVVGVK